MMSKIVEQIGQQLSRRRFLTTLGKVAMGAAAYAVAPAGHVGQAAAHPARVKTTDGFAVVSFATTARVAMDTYAPTLRVRNMSLDGTNGREGAPVAAPSRLIL